MSNYSIDLSYVEPSEGDLPGPPIAQLRVQCCTSDNEGHSYLTPRCYTFEELDEQIRRIEGEISEIRERAKALFAPR